MNAPTLRLPQKLHLGQAEVHSSPARFRVAVCGRRWGKSYLALLEVLKRALAVREQAICFASPTFKQSRSRFRTFLQLLRDLPGDRVHRTNRSNLEVELANGSLVTFASVFEPDHVRGEGFNFLVLDEAGYCPAPTWTEVLRATLIDSGGEALIIGSPRGQGQLLHNLFLLGVSDEHPDWASWQFPTDSNPRLDPSEVESARRELPEDVFRQEYGAAFLESAAGVFRGLAKCIGGQLEEPRLGVPYVVGVDLGKQVDYTAIAVLNAGSRQLVYEEAFRGVDYVKQVLRIAEVSQDYNGAPIVVDSTGLGEPVVDLLRRTLGRSTDSSTVGRTGGVTGSRVVGVVLTSQTKADVIQKVQLEIERGRIGIPKSCRELIRELEVYSYGMTPKGTMTYSAPEGFHDDRVIALSLAIFGLPQSFARLDHLEPQWRNLIAQLEPYARRPSKYGLPARRGLVSVGYEPDDPIHEARLLQVCRKAGLVSDEEFPVLAQDLRRRIAESPRYARMGHSDGLDDTFGLISRFIEGEA